MIGDRDERHRCPFSPGLGHRSRIFVRRQRRRSHRAAGSIRRRVPVDRDQRTRPARRAQVDSDHGRHTEGPGHLEQMRPRAASGTHEGRRCARAAAPDEAAGVASRARRGARGGPSLGAPAADADGRPRCPARPRVPFAWRPRERTTSATNGSHRPGPRRRDGRSPRRSRASSSETVSRQTSEPEGRTPASTNNAPSPPRSPTHPACGGRVGRAKVADLAATFRHPPSEQEPRHGRRALPGHGAVPLPRRRPRAHPPTHGPRGGPPPDRPRGSPRPRARRRNRTPTGGPARRRAGRGTP